MRFYTLIGLLFVVPLFLSSSGCKKNNHGLPVFTTEGRNIIGCKINGVPWVPRGISGGGMLIYPTRGGYYALYNSPLVHIWIKTVDPEKEIDLFVRNYNDYNFLKPGKYFFNRNTASLPFGYGEKHSYGVFRLGGEEYITDSIHTGWIEIVKSDSIQGIVSGRFEFEAYHPANGKTYQITEGRFDYTNH